MTPASNRSYSIGRLALILFLVSLAGFGLAIALKQSDATWLVWLVYLSAAAFLAATVLTVVRISCIGNR